MTGFITGFVFVACLVLYTAVGMWVMAKYNINHTDFIGGSVMAILLVTVMIVAAVEVCR